MRRYSLLGWVLLLSACDRPASKPASAASSAAPAASTPSPTATATASAAPPAPSASASAAPPRPREALPAPTFTAGKSKVPTVKEWKEAKEVSVRNARSLWCEVKVVREWLRVSCRSPEMAPNQIEKVFTDGTPVGEVYTFNGERVASTVVAIRPGTDARLTYTWSKWGERTLTVKYPKDAPEPQIGFDHGGPKGRAGVPMCDDVCFMRWHHKSDITCSTPCEPDYRCEVWRDSGELVTVCVCDLECADEEEKAAGTSL